MRWDNPQPWYTPSLFDRVFGYVAVSLLFVLFVVGWLLSLAFGLYDGSLEKLRDDLTAEGH